MQGMCVKQAGHVLGISEKTVSTYTNILLEKFGVDSVVGLTHVCHAAGAIQFGEIDRPNLAIATTSLRPMVSRSRCSEALPRTIRPTLAQLGADS